MRTNRVVGGATWAVVICGLGAIPQGHADAQNTGLEPWSEVRVTATTAGVFAPGHRDVEGVTQPRWTTDPGDTIYRQAREALNDGEFREAATMFAALREELPNSEYVGDSYYWEAYARFRIGSRSELDRAAELIAVQKDRYPSAATVEDAGQLSVRIQGQRARGGDSRALMQVAGQAAQPCDEDDQDLKAMAVSALMNMDAERARPILLEVLRQRDECSSELRASAVFILGQHMNDETVAVVMDLISGDPDPSEEVRGAAVFALAQSDSDAALDALSRLLDTSEDSEVLQHVVSALAQGSAEHRAAVMAYARRPNIDPEVRRSAVFMLGANGSGDAFDFLESMWVSASDDETREAVVAGIAQSTDPRAGTWLLSLARDRGISAEMRRHALFWYGQHDGGPEVGELLNLYAEFDDTESKEAVLFALSQHRSEKPAVDALIQVAQTEEDPELVQRALFWLGQSDDPRVAEILLNIIRR